ncbi:DedA family protein [Paenibacillus xerothermodurans]|uniref:DedA family protein n=1 Tax=Paenibacillus xerothermodurans TaxID=1977292 RepID=A0A2W1NN97_PAEXE|nr:DedA family protein [Paenibacillus xerothermodurans]PZE20925.1 DedA family protein [Paenibacillus xerothermodurans]
MLDELLLLIQDYGYIALYCLLALGIVGIPVPDEILMTAVGSLTSGGGPLSFGKSLAVSYAGTMTGMLISYCLGRTVGKPFLYKYGKWVKLTPERLEKTEEWFHRYGLWTVMFGYYVPGVRHFTCYWAGVSNVSLWRYLVYSGSGALIWCLSFLSLGHFIGVNAPRIMELVHHYIGVTVFTIVILTVIVIYFYIRHRRKQADLP